MICVVVSDLPESGQKLVVGRSGLNLRIYLTIVLCEVLIVKRFNTAQRSISLLELDYCCFLLIGN